MACVMSSQLEGGLDFTGFLSMQLQWARAAQTPYAFRQTKVHMPQQFQFALLYEESAKLYIGACVPTSRCRPCWWHVVALIEGARQQRSVRQQRSL